ncbi:MAG TPA: XRE family transcriptional regulator, partial [Phycisphaerales bacterium]|nr:XRE family transcriptional regulator [Phycisphaerales bacterium]
DRTVFNNGFDITLSFKPAVGLIGLRKVRRLRGVSQKQLADAIGVSIQFISLLETGKRNCSSEVLQKLAYVLRCTTDELIKAPSYSGGENCGTVTNG